MDSTSKKQDVEWNKDGRPVNWNGRNWPLFSRTMKRYLACYDVAENQWSLDDICDGTVTYDGTNGDEEEKRFLKQELLLAKLISSSLSCTLAQQVMRFDYGSEIWEYLAARFEGRENEMTTLYTQRVLRQKLEGASCRPGADVENHLLYMMGLREQLKALDADVSDAWMVDFMVRSISQLPYYKELKMLMLTSGLRSARTPEQVKSVILVLEKEELVEKQLQSRVNNGSGNQGGSGRGNGGKKLPNSNGDGRGKPSAKTGGGQKPQKSYKKRTEEQQRQYEEDRDSMNCFGCHQPGHLRKNCPEEVKKEPENSSSDSNARRQANLTVTPMATSQRQQTQNTLDQGGGDTKPVYKPGKWVFDNGATQHLVGDKRYFVNYRDLSPQEREKAKVHGYNGTSSPLGIGAIDLWALVDESPVVLRIQNVYFSPGKTNLFSQSIATEQGFQIAYDDSALEYTLSMNGAVALRVKMQPCKLWIFTAANSFLSGDTPPKDLPTPQVMVNYALRDGVADLQSWHERLGHICPQFVRQMADQGLVEGMMLRKRQFDLCEACQLGKQREKTPLKKLDRGVKRRNQLVFADLFFPPRNYNCTRFQAVLVVMDAHTRFLTAYPVQTKHQDEINGLVRRYIAWAERQWPADKVAEVYTDGGGEFENNNIKDWYQAHGIIHTVTPKKMSRLNMVERTHQTLGGMMKAMMKDSGFPTSFWVEALHYAVYLKNRSFSSATNRTPYEEMWGRKPDIHHVRKFGALAYMHVKVGPSRHKFADNCKIGYVLGHRDGTLGYKVYLPSEGTVQIAGQVTVNEQIMYKDRHKDGFDQRVRDWVVEEHPDLTSTGRRDYDLPAVRGRGDAGGSTSSGSDGGSASSARETAQPRKGASQDDYERVEHGNDEDSPNSASSCLQRPLPNFTDEVVLHPDISRRNKAKDRATCSAGDETSHGVPEVNTSPNTMLFDNPDEPANTQDNDETDFRNAELMAEKLLEEGSASCPERKRPGLVEVSRTDDGECDLEDLQVYAALAAIGLEAAPEKPQQRVWHESEVRIPRTVKQAMDSPQRSEWWKGMEKELAAMEDKDVLELVPESEMPEGTKLLETMWRFQAKTDDLGNILRYRPRLCERGDKEIPGVDFQIPDTFSPVARMASFRMLIALCKILKLLAFQCDINTAYLNARRKLVRFIKRIAGFPLKPGWVYKVKNALYGLHESGRDWYDELHGWLSEKGLQRSMTEPCLYYFADGETIALVLVYVDDVICATNNETWKSKFFTELNEKYGIKDLGRLHTYLGVQVDWREDGAFLHQKKYAQEVLQRFGYADAVGCRSPMDTTVKLQAAREGDKEPGLPYREAIGALMYLATSTRPDLAFPVGYLSRFVQHPNVHHAGALKRILRYLAATQSHGVLFENQDDHNPDKLVIDGYVDADWGNCPDTRKSVSGYVLKMAGGPVAWAARRQSIVALSTAEAEYAATCEACQEGKSIQNILTEIVGGREVEFRLGVDNQATIALATQPTYSRKTRHIELRLHFVREMVQQKGVELWKVSGENNPADLLTKPMGFTRLDKLKVLVGMQPQFMETKRESQRRLYQKERLKRVDCS